MIALGFNLGVEYGVANEVDTHMQKQECMCVGLVEIVYLE